MPSSCLILPYPFVPTEVEGSVDNLPVSRAA